MVYFSTQGASEKKRKNEIALVFSSLFRFGQLREQLLLPNLGFFEMFLPRKEGGIKGCTLLEV